VSNGGDATVVEYAASMRSCKVQMSDGTTLTGVIVKSGSAWQICKAKSATGDWTNCTTFDPDSVVSIVPTD